MTWVQIERTWVIVRRVLSVTLWTLLALLGAGLLYGLTQLNYEVILDNLPRLGEGVWLTIELLALTLLVALVLALPLTLGRLSANPLLSLPSKAYIFAFRGTPLLVQIFLVYYGLGQFEFIRESVLWPILREPYWCAVIAFGLHTTAYQAEILRGAIQAVPKGEIEAARAIGMSRSLAMRRIILPSALRIGFPAYSNEVILMLKGTALASTITLLDLTGMARTVISRTYMPVEIFLAAGVFYLLLTFLLTRGFRMIETRITRHLRPPAA